MIKIFAPSGMNGGHGCFSVGSVSMQYERMKGQSVLCKTATGNFSGRSFEFFIIFTMCLCFHAADV